MKKESNLRLLPSRWTSVCMAQNLKWVEWSQVNNAGRAFPPQTVQSNLLTHTECRFMHLQPQMDQLIATPENVVVLGDSVCFSLLIYWFINCSVRFSLWGDTTHTFFHFKESSSEKYLSWHQNVLEAVKETRPENKRGVWIDVLFSCLLVLMFLCMVLIISWFMFHLIVTIWRVNANKDCFNWAQGRGGTGDRAGPVLCSREAVWPVVGGVGDE